MYPAATPTAPRRAAPTASLVIATMLAACTPEPPPRTVADFLDNPRLLEATMVRCAQNRSELKYTPECLNAREAVDRLAAQEEAARRSELDAQSARKREALRRAQEAAAAARARAEEEARLREEAELLGHYEELPEGGQYEAAPERVPQDPAEESNSDMPPDVDPTQAGAASEPALDEARNDTVSDPAPASDLSAVREELRRRQESDGQQ